MNKMIRILGKTRTQSILERSHSNPSQKVAVKKHMLDKNTIITNF